MAAGDFIHKQLLNAGSRDAVSNMLAGAGIGAAANVGLGAAQGDFNILGNAAGGAMLGGIGGAAVRHAGAKYGSGLMDAASKGEKFGGFQVSTMTRKVEEPGFDFWGKNTDAGNMNNFRSAANEGPQRPGPKAGANTAGNQSAQSAPVPQQQAAPVPQAASVSTPAPVPQAAPKNTSNITGINGVGSSPNAPLTRQTYGGGRANSAPVPAPAPVAAVDDGLGGARDAIQRADAWTAGQKSMAAQEKADKVRLQEVLGRNASHNPQRANPNGDSIKYEKPEVPVKGGLTLQEKNVPTKSHDGNAIPFTNGNVAALQRRAPASAEEFNDRSSYFGNSW